MDRQIRALEIFHNRYGIWANPEDYPGLWKKSLDQAADEFEAEAVAGELLTHDEGGEV